MNIFPQDFMQFLFRLTFISIITAFVFGAPLAYGFSDVSSKTLYNEAILSLRNRGVIKGYDDGTFKPVLTINRAEFVKIILEGREEGQSFTGADCFPDVHNEWFSPYICTAHDEGIIDGYPDGTFKPEQQITFVEASKIIANAYEQKVQSHSSNWYEPFVRSLESSKAIPPSIQGLDQKIVRGEMAEMMWRLSEKRIDQPAIGYFNIKYPDVSVNMAADVPQKPESCADLKAFAQEAKHSGTADYYMENDMMPMPMTARSGMSMADTAAMQYSDTNVQVQGVDESDIVKTDGAYLYTISKEDIHIVKALPASSLRTVATIRFDDSTFYPHELFLNNDRLIVLGQSSQSSAGVRTMIAPERWPQPHNTERSEVRIYDVSNPSNPIIKRKVSFEGSLVSSRRIEDKVYLVVNQYQQWANIPLAELNEENLLPRFEDSAKGKALQAVARCNDVTILPRVPNPSYLTVAVIPTHDTTEDIQREVILGNAENVYMSQKNLFLASTEWNYTWKKGHSTSSEKTAIHRFSLTENGITFSERGSVAGHILNQFSMDEYENHFRIATTVGQSWNESNPSMNNLYVLNMNMEQVGSVEDIAPGETIYSTRFLGDRTYMVTFKNIDPFFVIDTADPRNPRILGKLKIPGYSDYLHPYDEHHIIGFGKEAVESKEGDFAWYQGMKIAIFDVSNVKNPKELHKVTIGDRGTESPLLRNHKALLFDKKRNLLSFPVTVHMIKDKSKEGAEWGEPVFQGAYVYDLTLRKGFVQKGSITHYDEETFLKSGDYWYDRGNDIQRIVRIGDSLFTISHQEIQSHSLDDVHMEGKVILQPSRSSGDFEDIVY